MITMLLLNNKTIDNFKFPGGEIQVRIPQLIEEERVILTWKPTNSNDLMMLLLTCNALKNAGIYDVYLDCLYLPYARQDRVCSPGEALSLEVICKILDSLELTGINLWDVHNEATTFQYFLNSFVMNIEIVDIFKRFKIIEDFDTDNLLVCAPDGGAMSKAQDLCNQLQLSSPVYFEKTRDQKTGEILTYDFRSFEWCIDDRDILVVDDICDGGRTFIEAAKYLKEKTEGKLFLYVTHGIFSKGTDELLEWYEHIYCHHVLDDSRYQSNERLTILRSFANV